jgi:hypothetical protein
VGRRDDLPTEEAVSELKPINFVGAEGVLGAPPDWDPTWGICSGLPVMRIEGCVVSHWRPTFRQRLAILFGCGIWLWVRGQTQPPVSMNLGRAGEAPPVLPAIDRTPLPYWRNRGASE